jgi:hypothetical protein
VEELKKQAFNDHKQDLLNQITRNEEKMKLERLDYLEEGRKVR